MADRAGTAGDQKPLIFPLLAEPSPRRRWFGKALAACVIAAVLAVTSAVAVDRFGADESASKWAVVAAGSSGSLGGSGGGTASVFELLPGTCLRTLETGADVRDVPIVSCDVPHEAEVIATVRMPAGPWPGQYAVDAFATERCVPEIHANVVDGSGLLWSYYAPSMQSWEQLGDHTVTCLLLSDRELLVGSRLVDAGAASSDRALFDVGSAIGKETS